MPHSHFNLANKLLLPELELEKFHSSGGVWRLYVKKTSTLEICPHCASPRNWLHSKRQVRIKDRPLDSKCVELFILKRRFRCLDCKRVFTEPISGIYKGRKTTERFRKALFKATQNYTNLSKVRKEFNCSNWLVYTVLYQQLDLKAREKFNEPWPKTIGIDENRFGKCPRYKVTKFSTVVADFNRQRVIELVDGRDGVTLKAELGHIPGRERVTHVAMDLSSTFRKFVLEFFPNAKIVADHFHVVRLLIPQINRLRKQYTGDKRKNPIRKLLLCNGSRLDFVARRAIEKWLEDKDELREVYQAKEALHRIYRIKGYNRAKKAFFKFTDYLARSESKIIKTFRRTLLNWKWEILRYFSTGITNARTEGFNNKIKLVKKNGYGYKNHENFRMRVLNACT